MQVIIADFALWFFLLDGEHGDDQTPQREIRKKFTAGKRGMKHASLSGSLPEILVRSIVETSNIVERSALQGRKINRTYLGRSAVEADVTVVPHHKHFSCWNFEWSEVIQFEWG